MLSNKSVFIALLTAQITVHLYFTITLKFPKGVTLAPVTLTHSTAVLVTFRSSIPSSTYLHTLGVNWAG